MELEPTIIVKALEARIATAVKYGLDLNEFATFLADFDKRFGEMVKRNQAIEIIDNETEEVVDYAHGKVYNCPKCGTRNGDLMFSEMENIIHCWECGETWSSTKEEIDF